MIGALLYLRLTSLRNQVVHRLGRLRQPRYLLGALFAAGYFYYFVFRHFGAAGAGGGVPPQFARSASVFTAGLICAAVCAVGVIRVAYAWISPPEKAGLQFTEPEIAFLFPAPFTRRALIHFRLLSSQFAILFSAALITIVFNRSGYLGGSRILRAVGWWIILSTIDLHVNGTNLMLARLRETCSPARFIACRVAAVALILAFIAAAYLSSAEVVSAFVAGADFRSAEAETARLAAQLHGSAKLYWLTLPFRIVLGPYLAAGYREFAVALLPALAVVALHYLWVSTSQASFEEGSIALAARRAAMRAAISRGEAPRLGGSRPKALAGPFPLPPGGLPEVAFLWKNLLSLRSSVFSRRTLGIVIGVATWMYFVTGGILRGRAVANRGEALGIIVLMCCGIVAAYTLLLGPQIARQDLRSDLPNADLLKTFPLEGWRVALGELLAPTAILTSIIWVTIIVAAAAVDPGRRMEWLTPSVRATVALCLGLAAPLLCLIQLIVPNMVMILMPAWYQTSRSRAGIEMFGQRLLFGLLQLLFAFIVAAPAAGAAALVVFASSWVLGISGAVVLATALSLVILAGEAAVGVWYLGERFERFDLSTEAR